MEMLRIEKLYVRRGTFLLKDINIAIEEGETCAIVGKSGSGKSTLIRAIGGAVEPAAGKILYAGRERYEDECAIRKEMSVIYDSPNFNTELKPERLVRELEKFEPWFDRGAFAVYMQQLELNPRLRVKLYAEEMQKKLMLTIALCRKPKLLVMDESTSGVDKESRQGMWEMIEAYRQKYPLTLVFSTHHEEEVQRADCVWRLSQGCCKEDRDEAIL
ncbi:MAG: ABC transporter ATP-binding protein [Lachnospiraceae bacterium]|nr:ABC transporter ATP-binding protein [Lachnospiraceae bacterium]